MLLYLGDNVDFNSMPSWAISYGSWLYCCLVSQVSKITPLGLSDVSAVNLPSAASCSLLGIITLLGLEPDAKYVAPNICNHLFHCYCIFLHLLISWGAREGRLKRSFPAQITVSFFLQLPPSQPHFLYFRRRKKAKCKADYPVQLPCFGFKTENTVYLHSFFVWSDTIYFSPAVKVAGSSESLFNYIMNMFLKEDSLSLLIKLASVFISRVLGYCSPFPF